MIKLRRRFAEVRAGEATGLGIDLDKDLTTLRLREAAKLAIETAELRDALLYEAACQGFAVAMLAEAVGLSRQRVHQIVRQRGRSARS